jgi:hypothetical protein
MSHLVTVKTSIKDLDTLEVQAKSLGCTLHRGRVDFKNFANRRSNCSHAISVDGNSKAYEIGLVDNTEGGYNLVYDMWNHGDGLEEKVGAQCEKLVQGYVARVAETNLRRQGLQLRSTEQLANGQIKVTFRR